MRQTIGERAGSFANAEKLNDPSQPIRRDQWARLNFVVTTFLTRNRCLEAESGGHVLGPRCSKACAGWEPAVRGGSRRQVVRGGKWFESARKAAANLDPARSAPNWLGPDW